VRGGGKKAASGSAHRHSRKGRRKEYYRKREGIEEGVIEVMNM